MDISKNHVQQDNFTLFESFEPQTNYYLVISYQLYCFPSICCCIFLSVFQMIIRLVDLNVREINLVFAFFNSHSHCAKIVSGCRCRLLIFPFIMKNRPKHEKKSRNNKIENFTIHKVDILWPHLCGTYLKCNTYTNI